MSETRRKLELEIEKQLHRFTTMVKEHVTDYTVLTVRKHHPELDRNQLTKVLEIVSSGIDDGFMMNIDQFMKNLDSVLLEFSDNEENPTQPTAKSKAKK